MNTTVTTGLSTFADLIKAAQAGRFIRVAKVDPKGSLEARKISTGAIVFYWRYSADGKSGRESIGQYSPSNPPRSTLPIAGFYSLTAAKAAASVMAGEHEAHKAKGGYAELKAVKKQVASDDKAIKQARESKTLEALMMLYIALLAKQGKASHRDVLNIVTNHLIAPHPKLAAKPACEVTAESIADVIRSVIESGKARTANKLRSYLHAAFKIAAGAKLNAATPLAFKAFAITVNPITSIPANSDANKADKNPVKVHELQAYWQAIQGLEGKRGALLRIHLLTGGLRPQQLLRLNRAGIDGATFTLHDIKGKRSNPRPYTTPMLQCVQDDLKLFAGNEGYVFSLDGGTTAIRGETLGGWAKEAVSGVVQDFQLKRVRSGIETLLASKRVSSDIRAQLQSHGISGVQAKNYDAYHYLPEKLEALNILFEATSVR
jgi:hypothetical protein